MNGIKMRLGGMGRDFGRLGALGGAPNISGPAYLGQVATRCYMHDAEAASTTGWNGRTAHYARDTITSLQVLFCNWKVSAGTGETGQGGTMGITASVEYPVGVYTQIKFNSGSSSVSLADLAQILSDATVVSIPKGALFWIRAYYVPSVGILYCYNGISRYINLGLGDAVDNSNVDKSMSGTIVDTGNGSMIPIQAIVAQTGLPTIGVGPGSSRMAGAQDTTVDATGDTGYTRMFGGNFAYIDCSVGGDTTVEWTRLGAAKRRAILSTYCSHLWLDPGLNDFSYSEPASNVVGALQGLANLWPGGLGRVIFNDESTITSSSDGWTTTSGQTAGASESFRETLNASIDAFTGYNQIVKPAAFDGNGADYRFWNNPVVGGYQTTPDGIHENSATLILMKNAGIFNRSLITRAGAVPVLPQQYAGSSIDLDFANAIYNGGTPSNCFAITRSTSKTDLLPASASGAAYNTFSANTLAITPTLGILIEDLRTNLFLNSTVPVTQTITLSATGSYTLWCNGSGSAAIAAGSATITGAGTATNGTPVTISCSGTGTVVVTITGSLNACQLEAGTFGTSLIVTAGASATRNPDAVTAAGALLTLLQATANSILLQTNLVKSTTSLLISGNTDNLYLQYAGPVTGRSTLNSVGLTQVLGTGSSVATGLVKFAFGIDGTGRALMLNDGIIATDTGNAKAANTSYKIGGLSAGNFYINGYIPRLTAWTSRLSNNYLQSLTI